MEDSYKMKINKFKNDISKIESELTFPSTTRHKAYENPLKEK